MNQGRVIIITGSPGTGKTTIASIVAKESDFTMSVHMHTDDFIITLVKGQYLHICLNLNIKIQLSLMLFWKQPNVMPAEGMM